MIYKQLKRSFLAIALVLHAYYDIRPRIYISGWLLGCVPRGILSRRLENGGKKSGTTYHYHHSSLLTPILNHNIDLGIGHCVQPLDGTT